MIFIEKKRVFKHEGKRLGTAKAWLNVFSLMKMSFLLNKMKSLSMICSLSFAVVLQIPVTLLEYSLNAVTEGIDAIATTRVVIRSENAYTTMHAQTGESVQRTFRYSIKHAFFFCGKFF